MQRIDFEVIDETSRQAKVSPRRRMNFNFHQLEDPLQRLVNAIEPESYIRPHRHRQPGKAEVFLVLKGKGAAFEFDRQGNIVEHHIMEDGGPVRGAIFDPGAWHTIIALESGTVFFEVKVGPYEPLTDKDFAPWAPFPEDLKRVRAFQKGLWERLGLVFPSRRTAENRGDDKDP